MCEKEAKKEMCKILMNADDKTLNMLGLYLKAFNCGAINFDRWDETHSALMKLMVNHFRFYSKKEDTQGNLEAGKIKRALYILFLGQLPNVCVCPQNLDAGKGCDKELFRYTAKYHLIFREYNILLMLFTMLCQAGVFRLNMADPGHRELYEDIAKMACGCREKYLQIPEDDRLQEEACYVADEPADRCAYMCKAFATIYIMTQSSMEEGMSMDLREELYLFMEITRGLATPDGYVERDGINYKNFKRRLNRSYIKKCTEGLR